MPKKQVIITNDSYEKIRKMVKAGLYKDSEEAIDELIGEAYHSKEQEINTIIDSLKEVDVNIYCPEPSIDDTWRDMLVERLTEVYGLKGREPGKLRRALNPAYFPTISNAHLSLKNMAKRCGLDEDTIADYRIILIKTNLTISKNEPEKQNLAISTLEQGGPFTVEEIANIIDEENHLVSSALNRSSRQYHVYRVTLKTNQKSKYRAEDIFGKLGNRAIYFLRGQEEALADKIVKCIPKNLSEEKTRASTRYLKASLPGEIYGLVIDKLERY